MTQPGSAEVTRDSMTVELFLIRRQERQPYCTKSDFLVCGPTPVLPHQDYNRLTPVLPHSGYIDPEHTQGGRKGRREGERGRGKGREGQGGTRTETGRGGTES